jgi:YidC/Oxa1 family membrane protein insertase
MHLWAMWLDLIRDLLQLFSSVLGAGLGIVALTLVLRVALLPISWTSAYRGCIQQKKLRKLQPELQRVREEAGDQPHVLAERTLAVYRKHGVSPLDVRSLLGAVAQMPVLLGMFQILRDSLRGVRFLWIASLSRPDTVIALIAGLTTALMMLANPDLPENLRLIMIVVPAVIAIVVALKFSSALAVYWAVSNCFAAVQTVAVHWLVARRVRMGLVRI